MERMTTIDPRFQRAVADFKASLADEQKKEAMAEAELSSAKDTFQATDNYLVDLNTALQSVDQSVDIRPVSGWKVLPDDKFTVSYAVYFRNMQRKVVTFTIQGKRISLDGEIFAAGDQAALEQKLQTVIVSALKG
jgi:hypothetical protein